MAKTYSALVLALASKRHISKDEAEAVVMKWQTLGIDTTQQVEELLHRYYNDGRTKYVSMLKAREKHR